MKPFPLSRGERFVSKKLPGKRPELIAYDPLNRVVAVGPVNSPFENDNTVGVIHTRYDQFNRVVFTYWVETGTFEETHRQAIENSITSVVSESLLETPETDAGTQVYYTRDVAPQTGKQYLTKFAYDRYQFEGAPTNFSETILGQTIHYNNSDKKPKGMPTTIWVRALEDRNTVNRSVTYMLYDKKGRTIRTHSTNYTGGYTQTDTQYNNLVDSKVVKTVTKHKRTSSDSEITLTEDFTYTAQDRLEKHTHKINSLSAQMLSYNQYNALGQLITKKVGDISESQFLQQVDYKYNIRGWLTDINNVDNLSISPDPVDLFAFRINYNGTIQYDVNGMVEPLYNGNIAETTWRTASDNIRRRYAYSYDYLNRLRDAWYQVPGTTMPVSNAYNEHLTYDSNGNILTLFRTGEVDDPDNVLEIDDLEYEYDDGNKLINVIDYTTHSAGFNAGNTSNDPDFEYDDYGNLIIDRNKGINEITYNHLNLPKKIVFENDNTIEYLYDANGTKLRKIVTDNTTNPIAVTTIHYIDGFQYNGNTMDFFPTAEGYVKVTHSSGGGIGGGAITYNYVFNYTDHLGNIRLRYAINPVNQWLEILEEDHYYPFGLKHQGYNAENYVFASLGDGPVQLIPTNPNVLETYKFKYNQKEWQNEFSFNVYDYGARNYMPDLGRFFNMDNMTEMYETLSPYNYTGNNPVNFIDINGEWIYVYDEDKKYRYENGQTQHQVDGQWTAIDNTVELSDFAISAIAGLSALENNGKTGKSLIDHFSNDKNNANIRYQKGVNRVDVDNREDIYVDHNLKANTWVQGSNGNPTLQESPFYINLGHELAHVQDPTKFYFDSGWYGKAGTSEIRASHIENKLRAEAGLPLRTHYGSVFNLGDKKEYPNPVSTLIDKQGNSVYYTRSERRVGYERGVTPNQGGIRDGKNAHGGEILKYRFNYNE